MQSAWPIAHLSVPAHNTSLKLVLDPDHLFDDKAYFAFCRVNPDLRVERNAEGEILIVPPAGSESSYRSASVTAQLFNWAEQDGRGTAFESSAQFMLPDGSALSPDAAWVSNVSLRRLSRQKRKEFLPLCPEFVGGGPVNFGPTQRRQGQDGAMDRQRSPSGVVNQRRWGDRVRLSQESSDENAHAKSHDCSCACCLALGRRCGIGRPRPGGRLRA
jgi:putative restriction endonuclease